MKSLFKGLFLLVNQQRLFIEIFDFAFRFLGVFFLFRGFLGLGGRGLNHLFLLSLNEEKGCSDIAMLQHEVLLKGELLNELFFFIKEILEV